MCQFARDEKLNPHYLRHYKTCSCNPSPVLSTPDHDICGEPITRPIAKLINDQFLTLISCNPSPVLSDTWPWLLWRRFMMDCRAFCYANCTKRGLAMTGEVIRFRVILSNPNKTLSYMRPWLLRRRLMMDCKDEPCNDDIQE